MTPPRQPYANTLQLGLFETSSPLRVPERVAELPKTAQDLVNVIGLDATIDMVKMFGGDEVQIPEVVGGTARMWDTLVDAIGIEAATKLVTHFKAARIYVPMCQAALKNARNREIIASYDAGEPFDAIRRRHRVSRSYLFRLLKKPS